MKPLAKNLIKKFGSFGDVFRADPARLLEVDGVGEVTVAAIDRSSLGSAHGPKRCS
jgi:DNA repair protein RadC